MPYCAGDGRSCGRRSGSLGLGANCCVAAYRRDHASSLDDRGSGVPGRVLIAEPSLVDGRGHQAAAVRRFVELIGMGSTTIAAGAHWRGPPSIAGARVVALFKRDRQGVARVRRYGPLLGRVLTIADLAAEPVAEVIRRRRDGPGGGSTV